MVAGRSQHRATKTKVIRRGRRREGEGIALAQVEVGTAWVIYWPKLAKTRIKQRGGGGGGQVVANEQQKVSKTICCLFFSSALPLLLPLALFLFPLMPQCGNLFWVGSTGRDDGWGSVEPKLREAAASKAAKQIKSTINSTHTLTHRHTVGHTRTHRHWSRHSVKVNVTAHLIARTARIRRSSLVAASCCFRMPNSQHSPLPAAPSPLCQSGQA